MLSDETKRHIHDLLARQDDYRPGVAVRAILAKKTLIMLVGPTGAGKSTVMREVTKQRPEISIVGTITTRPPRPDDQVERYTFYEHTDEGLRPLFEDIAAGKLVQYVVNPFSGQIYGSSPADYPAAVNIGDYFSSVVTYFAGYGFGRIIPITLVTTPGSWRQRFDDRFPPGHPQRESRRAEAMESLAWSLDSHETAHYFVFNPDGSPGTAARDVLAAVDGNLPDQAQARAAAEECFAAIRDMAA